ncbi:hypothetical protein HK405_003243 [Cladochytrium tenue]|nr:hypothetical protein HK405_003243 [Cladochytrium tenue]
MIQRNAGGDGGGVPNEWVAAGKHGFCDAWVSVSAKSAFRKVQLDVFETDKLGRAIRHRPLTMMKDADGAFGSDVDATALLADHSRRSSAARCETPPQTPSPTIAPCRLEHLDGLRGLAALHVVFSHTMGYWSSGRSLLMYYQPWSFSVPTFFLLSGAVVARGILRSRDTGKLLSSVFRRPVRFLPAVYLSALLITVMLRLKVLRHPEDYRRADNVVSFFLEPLNFMGLKELCSRWKRRAVQAWQTVNHYNTHPGDSPNSPVASLLARKLGRPARILAGALLVLAATACVVMLGWSRPRLVEVQRPVRVAWFTSGLGEQYFFMAAYQVAETRRHFCADRPWVHSDFFVFTNASEDQKAAWLLGDTERFNTTCVHKSPRGWPMDSEDRFKWIAEVLENRMDEYDYAIWQDSDNQLAHPVCLDLMGSLVGAMHPHIGADSGPYESNNESMAYIPDSGYLPYFSAHIFGGTPAEILKLTRTCAKWTDLDHSRGIQARVDDESYLNAYFHKARYPTKMLSRGFVWPDYGDKDWFPRARKYATAVSKHNFFSQNRATHEARVQLAGPRWNE